MKSNVTLGRLGTLLMRFMLFMASVALSLSPAAVSAPEKFEGEYFSGEGDVEYLKLLDISRRMFSADPEFQNLPMLYKPVWNGFVEGPTWDAWWIQNSYGPSYCGMPLLEEPLFTFLFNAQDLWYEMIGDGKRVWKGEIVPDGQLCDCARPGMSYPKQGDGPSSLHDWGMEYTAAGLVMQAEMLLVSRNLKAIARYLPKLRRCANFIETRRDPEKNLFLAGPAGNLLAPNYAGCRQPDGSFGQAYLAGLSINYIAGLNRLIELEKLSGNTGNVKLHTKRRDLALKGLPLLTTDEGYFMRSLDPDGTPHGVYGAAKHGYFDAISNHDAMCFRVVDDEQAEKIYRKIDSLPGLRPHNLILTNYPSLDDMYRSPSGMFRFGHWVNGGHWSTCEARMIMGYYRVGQHDDAQRAMEQIMTFARKFRLDNNLTNFGSAVYMSHLPINLVYDTFGIPTAMVRGLFEYLYQANDLVLVPHIPAGISRLQQHFPVRFGKKKLYLNTVGRGPVTAVLVNGQPVTTFDEKSITLAFGATPVKANIQIAFGGAKLDPNAKLRPAPKAELPDTPKLGELAWARKIVKPLATNKLPLRIGADSKGENPFRGKIARARVFNRELSMQEIASLAKAAPTDPSSADVMPIGDWILSRVKGQSVANQVGDGLTAQVVGKCNLVTDSDPPAMEFNGEGYLEVDHDRSLDLPKCVTLSAWICPAQQTGNGGCVINKCVPGTSNGYSFEIGSGNSIRLVCRRGTTTHNANLAPGRWTHVAVLSDPYGQLEIYINGRQWEHWEEPNPIVFLADIDAKVAQVRKFYAGLAAAGLTDCYEAAHARLAVEYLATTCRRFEMLSAGELTLIPAELSQTAADKSYLVTTEKLCDGLVLALDRYKESDDPHKKQVYKIWNSTTCNSDEVFVTRRATMDNCSGQHSTFSDERSTFTYQPEIER